MLVIFNSFKSLFHNQFCDYRKLMSILQSNDQVYKLHVYYTKTTF